MNHEVPLTVEFFLGGDEEEFRIASPREIRFIMYDIEKNAARAALYYDKRKEFLLTSVVDVDDDGIWLDASQNHEENLKIAGGGNCIFVSSHHQAKVQFETDTVELTELDGIATLYVPMPDELLRIQRRDFFRLHLPTGALRCTLLLEGDPPRERGLPVRDISRGGVAIYCDEDDADLQPGKTIDRCRLRLDEETELTVAIQVRYFSITPSHTGKARGCAGCRFVNLDGKTEVLLQRYITMQQKAQLL
ncbi:MAG: flagellar brake protein [Betaproteobacteria bacterium]|nr:flagellar brake protein [Betaproteobacteria bacterium]MDE2623432.1 flagellar brake protein [Betaproteobacteria bacterium]